MPGIAGIVEMVIHRDSCHCGAVVIEVEAPAQLEAYECNCSMCERTAFLHLIVPAPNLRLVQGADALTTYSFNTHVARHYFCARCGCRPYYLPRSNPDGYSVNVRCLDHATVEALTVIPFDGKNWESHAGTLAHLSSD